MRIKAVLFDLDGTLLDTSYDLFTAAEHTHQTINQQLSITRSELYPFYGNGVRGILSQTLQREPTPQECQLFLNYYKNNIYNKTREFAGISELLQEINQRSLLWGIVTNKPESFTHLLIKHFNYDQSAACIVGGDTTSEKKPHPKPLLHAANLINIQPESCLYIGDNLRDIQAGNAANMTTVAASYGFIPPKEKIQNWQANYIINSPLEVLSYV